MSLLADQSTTKVRARFSAVVLRLTGVSIVTNLAAFVTGPLQARSLGPSGRGAVAAVLATSGLLGTAGALGIGSFVNREVAKGRDAGVVLGSLFPIMAGIGVLIAVVGLPVTAVVSNGRSDVRVLLLVGLALMPVLLPASLLPSAAVGRSDWRPLYISRMIPALGGLAAVLTLFASGRLTVVSVVVATFVLSIASSLPFLNMLRGIRLTFERAVVIRGLRFGTAAGAGTVLIFANQRIDQVIMAAVGTAKDLGLYAVAVSVTSVSAGLIASAVGASLQPLIAAGEVSLVGRATRLTLWSVASVGLLLALVLPVLLPLLFGADFKEAVFPAQLLLLASIPLAGLTVLGPTLVAAGRPLTTAIAEGLALACGLPVLVLSVGRYGATGAASASLLSYSVSFAYLLHRSRSAFGHSLRSLLLPERGDLEWLRTRFGRPATCAPEETNPT